MHNLACLIKMKNIVCDIRDIFKDLMWVGALEELLQAAVLDPDQYSREQYIYLLKKGWPGGDHHRLVGGFADSGKIFLKVESDRVWGLVYVCNIPNNYHGNTVERIYPFTNTDIERVMYNH